MKQIYIHVGPPKTGSSAIQKWLSENTQKLKELQIYYPKHTTDSNGVSSGNLLAIYDRLSPGEYSLNQDKLSAILSDFEAGPYNIILLSSEFFFKRMEELKKAIPAAKFIAYLRDPIEKRESLYNQGIKRHSYTHLYNKQQKNGIPDLRILDIYINTFGKEDLDLRAYGEDYFQNKSIISDLLSSLGIEQEIKIKNTNRSYNFEALELKRWMNNLELENLEHSIDLALQSYDLGAKNYSLTTRKEYLKQRAQDQKILFKFVEKNDYQHLEKFIAELTEKKLRTFIKQPISAKDLKGVIAYLLKTIGKNQKQLLNIINASTHKKSEIAKIFNENKKEQHLAIKLYFLIKNIFNKK
ncbi:hypothetical protein EOL70_16845 [Leucothrix sargassi]|nr:hypothetical protein EOL70_16845 [Leucothrix sargassi]